MSTEQDALNTAAEEPNAREGAGAAADQEVSVANAFARLNEQLQHLRHDVEVCLENLNCRQGEIERLEQALRERTAGQEAELVQHQAALDARVRELDEREQSLQARESQLAQAQSEVSSAEEALRVRAQTVEEQDAKLTARAHELATRENAMKGFQAALADLAGVLKCQADDAHATAPPSSAASPESAAVANGSWPTEEVERPPSSPAPCPLPEQEECMTAPSEQTALSDDVDTPTAAETVASESVDLASLDAETRRKLRVMRRLTGGKVADEELLARIRNEAQDERPEPPLPPKSKRRWWGG